MKKKDFKREKQRVLHLVEKWSNALLLSHWRFDCYYYDGPIPGAGDDAFTTSHASIFVDWPYLRAYLKVNLAECQYLSWAELEKVIVHELMHVIVAEMRPEDPSEDHKRHEERVVSGLTNGVLRATLKGMTEWHPWPEE